MYHFHSGTCSVILSRCTLLTSNHMTFLVQFGNNLHLCVFQKVQISFAPRIHAILILFENLQVQIISKVNKKSSIIIHKDCPPFSSIDHFTVACLVAWPLNESEAGGDLVLIETSLLFLC